MRNMTATVEGDDLVIRIKIDAQTIADSPLSSSGKTKLIGMTAGRMEAVELPGVSKAWLSVSLMAKPD